MAVVRWTNWISGALLIVAALGFLVYLPASLAEYAREPEDVWLGVIWISVLVPLAALCFVNAKRSTKLEQSRWVTFANLAVI